MKATARQRLRNACVRKGHKQVAEEIEISESMLSHLINGRHNPGLLVAVRMQSRLHIPVSLWVDCWVSK